VNGRNEAVEIEDAFADEAVNLKSRCGFEFNGQEAGSLHISMLRMIVNLP
jgi:hypothetical protein